MSKKFKKIVTIIALMLSSQFPNYALALMSQNSSPHPNFKPKLEDMSKFSKEEIEGIEYEGKARKIVTGTKEELEEFEQHLNKALSQPNEREQRKARYFLKILRDEMENRFGVHPPPFKAPPPSSQDEFTPNELKQLGNPKRSPWEHS